MHKHIQISSIAMALMLTACSSSGSLSSMIPDRRPDYRTSSMENTLEVPPDLLGATIDSQYNIPDLNPSAIANYNTYASERVQRDQRGFIAVLPELNGVDVIESSGQLPFINVDASPDFVWRSVKRYWNQNGIRLAVEEPGIGIMETDWLVNKADLPSTGLSGILNGLLGFVSDTGERDRYRIRFSRATSGKTSVTIIFKKSVEKAQYEGFGKGELSGYTWEISDNDNPELQLEMTRRIALYIAGELQRQNSASAADANGKQPSQGSGRIAQLGETEQGLPALVFKASYDQAWRACGNALDNASYAIKDSDYNQGVYLVQYQPQSQAASDPSLWDKLWGSEKQKPDYSNQPTYLVRLADQGNYTVALVQNADGSNASAEQARQVIEAIYATL